MRSAGVCSVLLCLLGFVAAGSRLRSFGFTEPIYLFKVNETFLEYPGEDHHPHPGSPSGPRSYSEQHVGCVDTSGDSTNISYNIMESSGASRSHGDPLPFAVDSKNGSLIVTGDLDYEARALYEFEVGCSHNVETNLTAIAIVRVSLLPVNEFFPKVHPTTLPVLVSEEIPPGSIIVHVSDSSADNTFQVTDRDEGDEVLRYTLSVPDTPNAKCLSLDPDTGTLMLNCSLDVDEYDKTISGTITVCDIDPPDSKCPNLAFWLFIDSANDNPPLFEHDMYEATVRADMPVNSTLDLGIDCTDADSGSGALRGVELHNKNFSIWEVDSKGVLTLRESLDNRTFQRHEFTIRCIDGSDEDLATVVINVRPVNSLRFEQTQYSFSVERSKIPDYNIGAVRALSDHADGDIHYSILRGDGNFDIDADTGEIAMVDYVFAFEGSSFSLVVGATDGNFTTNCTVDIDVVGPLSAVGVATVTVSIFVVVLIILVVASLVCYRAFCVRKPKKAFQMDRDGIAMGECGAYGSNGKNHDSIKDNSGFNKLNQELDRPNQDSGGYERIPRCPVPLPPRVSVTSQDSMYEPIPGSSLPWQYFHEDQKPYHHYDYLRVRPKLELPHLLPFETWQMSYVGPGAGERGMEAGRGKMEDEHRAKNSRGGRGEVEGMSVEFVSEEGVWKGGEEREGRAQGMDESLNGAEDSAPTTPTRNSYIMLSVETTQ